MNNRSLQLLQSAGLVDLFKGAGDRGTEIHEASTMVAVYPPADVAAKIKPHAAPDQADCLHVTLVYLGHRSEEEAREALEIVEETVKDHASFAVGVNGAGAFHNDDASVRQLLVNGPGLVELRVALFDALEEAGLVSRHDQKHGFIPHMTLEYHHDKVLPEGWDEVGKLNLGWNCGEVRVVRGDKLVGRAALGAGPASHDFAERVTGKERLRVEVKVKDDEGKVLAGSWPDNPGKKFLPGGGVDANETLEEAGEREVAEETGWKVTDVKPTGEPDTVVPGKSRTVWLEARAAGEKDDDRKGADEGKFLRGVGYVDEGSVEKVAISPHALADAWHDLHPAVRAALGAGAVGAGVGGAATFVSDELGAEAPVAGGALGALMGGVYRGKVRPIRPAEELIPGVLGEWVPVGTHTRTRTGGHHDVIVPGEDVRLYDLRRALGGVGDQWRWKNIPGAEGRVPLKDFSGTDIRLTPTVAGPAEVPTGIENDFETLARLANDEELRMLLAKGTARRYDQASDTYEQLNDPITSVKRPGVAYWGNLSHDPRRSPEENEALRLLRKVHDPNQRPTGWPEGYADHYISAEQGQALRDRMGLGYYTTGKDSPRPHKQASLLDKLRRGPTLEEPPLKEASQKFMRVAKDILESDGAHAAEDFLRRVHARNPSSMERAGGGRATLRHLGSGGEGLASVVASPLPESGGVSVMKTPHGGTLSGDDLVRQKAIMSSQVNRAAPGELAKVYETKWGPGGVRQELEYVPGRRLFDAMEDFRVRGDMENYHRLSRESARNRDAVRAAAGDDWIVQDIRPANQVLTADGRVVTVDAIPTTPDQVGWNLPRDETYRFLDNMGGNAISVSEDGMTQLGLGRKPALPGKMTPDEIMANYHRGPEAARRVRGLASKPSRSHPAPAPATVPATAASPHRAPATFGEADTVPMTPGRRKVAEHLEKTAVDPGDVIALATGHTKALPEYMHKQLARHLPDAVTGAAGLPLGNLDQNPVSTLVKKQWPKAEGLAEKLRVVENASAQDPRLAETPVHLSDETLWSYKDRHVELDNLSPAILAHELRHGQQYTPRAGGVSRPLSPPVNNLADVPPPGSNRPSYGPDPYTLTLERDANRYALELQDLSDDDHAHMAAAQGTYEMAHNPALRGFLDTNRRLRRSPSSREAYRVGDLRNRLFDRISDLETRINDIESGLPYDRAKWTDEQIAASDALRQRRDQVADGYWRAYRLGGRLLEDVTPFDAKYWRPTPGVARDDLRRVATRESQRHAAVVNELRKALGDRAADAYDKKVLTELRRVAPPEVLDVMGGMPERYKQSSTRKERDLELWEQWKRTKSPHDLQQLMRQMDGAIQSEVNRWSGAIARPVLEAKAKRLALEAFETYDPNKGAALNTHLTNRLKKLSREVYTHQDAVRLPEYKKLKVHSYTRGYNELMAQHGREPTNAELQDHLGWSPKMVSSVQRGLMPELIESADVGGGLFERTSVWGSDSEDGIVDMFYYDLDPIDKLIFEHSTGYSGKKVLSNPELMRKTNLTQGQLSYRKRKIIDRLKELQE